MTKLGLIGGLLLLAFAWLCYEGLAGPRRNLTKRERKMVAEVGPKIASDPRLAGAAFQGDHSDHSNVLLVTGLVASAEALAALYQLIQTNISIYRVKPNIRVKVRPSTPAVGQ